MYNGFLFSSNSFKELILDKCNSIVVDDDGAAYKAAIDAMPNLEKLSIKEGFNYITESLYTYLNTKVQNGELQLRFLDDKYVDYSTIYNYSRSVFFSMDSFLNATTQDSDGYYSVAAIGDSRHIILSLVNDTSSSATADRKFKFDKTLFQLDVYGNHNKTYSMQFNITDRKQSSFTLSLSSFKNKPGSGSSISAAADSKLIINSNYGQNELKGAANSAAVSCHDITINCAKGSSLYILGGNGTAGENGKDNYADDQYDANKRGKAGSVGQPGIRCNSCVLSNTGISVKGGNGGNGGKGGNGTLEDGWDLGSHGGAGGNGGKGGNGIEYKTSFTNRYNCVVEGGSGGKGGNGGNRVKTWLAPDSMFYNGSKGSDGAAGSGIVKI